MAHVGATLAENEQQRDRLVWRFFFKGPLLHVKETNVVKISEEEFQG